jgi:hypothetical protein
MYTPAPGSPQSGIYGSPPSGIYGHTTPVPTTLGAAAGEVRPGKSKAGFLIAGLLVLIAAGVGIAIVVTGKKVEGEGSGSAVAAGVTHDAGSSSMSVEHDSGTATGSAEGSAGTATGSAGATTGSAGTTTGSAGTTTGSAGTTTGSATTQVGSAGSTPDVPTMSTITLTSTPSGAAIWIDGKDTGKKTPSPVEVERARGAVTITFKLAGHDDVILKKVSVAADAAKSAKLAKRGPIRTNPGRGSGSGRVDDTKLERPE